MSAIENLNKVQDLRDFLISQILYHSKTNNIQYERLEAKLLKSPFKSLEKQVIKIHGINYRQTFNI